jgi:hypothetical protein
MPDARYPAESTPPSCNFFTAGATPMWLETRAVWSTAEAGIGMDMDLHLPSGWPQSLPAEIFFELPRGAPLGSPTTHAIIRDDGTLDHPLNLISTRQRVQGGEVLGVAHCAPPGCTGAEASDIGQVGIQADPFTRVVVFRCTPHACPAVPTWFFSGLKDLTLKYVGRPSSTSTTFSRLNCVLSLLPQYCLI